MVGIEIAVLSLGEVKLIHIKNHESMLATVKMWMEKVIGEGLRCSNCNYFPFCLVYSRMFCFF